MATKQSQDHECRLLTRGNRGIDALHNTDTGLATIQAISDSNECYSWSWCNNGQLFAYCDRKSVHVLNGNTLSLAYELPLPLTRGIKFSPNGSYLCLWQPYIVRQGESGTPNLTIYKDSERIIQYYQRKQEGWFIQWTDDEMLCARNVTNEVHFFDGGCPGSIPTSRIQHECLSSFSLSPGKAPYHIAVHIKGIKGGPSCVQMYRYPRVTGSGAVIANRSFYKADNVQMKWNNNGTGILVLTTTDVDKTGASYYGEQFLYYLSVKGDGNTVPLDKKGPVYCIEWSPTANEFCVVYGFMPSKAALFNSKCDLIHDFGITHRNTALYNRHGNMCCCCCCCLLLCLGGFGNLRGNMQFWNMDTRTKISETQASDSTELAWAPNGIHIVTATTAPRLREGNGYKLWHYSSVLLHEVTYETKKELWAVEWQPVPIDTYPLPDLTAPPPITTIAKAVIPSSKQAYVPPSLRGKPRPLTESDIPPSKNKRKRDAQRKSKQQTTTTTRTNTSAQQDTIATTEYLLKESKSEENDKKIKNLKKKIKQIETLKQLKEEGKKLEANQIEKLKLEESILKELSQMQLNSN